MRWLVSTWFPTHRWNSLPPWCSAPGSQVRLPGWGSKRIAWGWYITYMKTIKINQMGRRIYQVPWLDPMGKLGVCCFFFSSMRKKHGAFGIDVHHMVRKLNLRVRFVQALNQSLTNDIMEGYWQSDCFLEPTNAVYNTKFPGSCRWISIQICACRWLLPRHFKMDSCTVSKAQHQNPWLYK